MCVGAGFPRPIARGANQGGENPPLRRIAWLRLIFKGHKSLLRGLFEMFWNPTGDKSIYEMASTDHASRAR
jgi:hypothetical protein